MRLCLFLLLLGFAPARAQGPDWVFHAGPFSGGTILAAHPNGSLFAGEEGYVAISWDDGRTWSVQSEEPLWPLEGEALSDGSLLAVTPSQVVRSFDRGRTWVDAGLSGEHLRHLAVDPAGPWYVSVDRAIYRTDDEGATWVELSADATGSIRDMIVADDGGVIVTYWGDNVAMMSRSTDRGATWHDVPSGGYTQGRPLIKNYDGSLYLPSHRVGESIPYAIDALLKSDDHGAMWSIVAEGPKTGAFLSPTYGRIVGVPGGLEWEGADLLASAASTFFETPGGTLLANTTSYTAGGFDPPIFGTEPSGVYRFNPITSTWSQTGPTLASVQALHVIEEGHLLVGTQSALIQSGSSGWEASGVNAGIRALLARPDGRIVLAMEYPWGLRVMEGLAEFPGWPLRGDCSVSAISEEEGVMVVAVDYTFYSGAGNLGVYRTADEGANWEHALQKIGNVRVLEAAGAGVFYAGTNGVPNEGNPGVGVYRSLDDALTWEPFIDGLTNTEVRALHADGPASVFVGTEDGVFYAQDGGAWVSIGLQGLTVYALARTADGLIAGTDQGAFRYDGSDWDGWGEALSERAVQVLLPVDTGAGAFLVAGTDRGVYVDRPGLLTTPVETTAVPHQASVRVYPNPARITLTVGVELPGPSSARVVLLDVLGRRVRQVWDGPLAAGRHTLDASVEHLPGGTYLLVVETNAQRETRAVTVIR